ncbi:MAG: PEPxxWA-CTERM sorting domain-containing protein [Azoarcus sp.]|jgi:hypothetical protein|nr:PEPxxWA-CTERM sorting domain-containing protein [Azoarcus sp.]
MNKLLSTSLLTLGMLSSASALAGSNDSIADLYGGHLYIVDNDNPITLTYGSATRPGISFATHSNVLYVATLDSDGQFVDSWRKVFQTKGNANDTATLAASSPSSFSFAAGANAYELVFKWQNLDTGAWYTSSVLSGSTPSSNSNGKYDLIAYFPGDKAVVGLDDGGVGSNGQIHWDWNDVIFQVSNVAPKAPQIPAVPEPETWAMLLAGLGLVGSVARRRNRH